MLLQVVKRLVPPAWKERLKCAMGFQTMRTRLENLHAAGFRCTGAVDVGAFEGEWATLANHIFKCPVVLFEPQPDKQLHLNRLTQHKPFVIEAVALGASPSRMSFALEETNSRLLSSVDASVKAVAQVEVDTLDAAMQRSSFQSNLLKVDVQGFELDVLRGASASLQNFEVIILEVSVIRIGPVPVFKEVMDFMHAAGYRLYDFLPMYYRPLDRALWQGDAFFVRNDSPLVANENWA
jgi:FkbM family methyltransferase